MSKYDPYNPSPAAHRGDCAIRAIAKVFNTDWETASLMLYLASVTLYDVQTSNRVIDALLRMKGFERNAVANDCPDCYTIADFVDANPEGTFVVGTGDHVAAVVDGTLYDAWDSSDEHPIYYWKKIKE